jgi:hypothetical protein
VIAENPGRLSAIELGIRPGPGGFGNPKSRIRHYVKVYAKLSPFAFFSLLGDKNQNPESRIPLKKAAPLRLLPLGGVSCVFVFYNHVLPLYSPVSVVFLRSFGRWSCGVDALLLWYI